jgi:citrate synthase
MAKKPTKAFITFDNDTAPIELPILSGTAGNDVIDIRTLGKHGVYTYDPGFMSTAACQSGITFIDGEKGLLQYRGYPIEQLAENCNFLEVSYLLMHGELPNATQLDSFTKTIVTRTMLHDQLSNVFRGFRRDAHPMAVMIGVVGSMS